MKIEELKSGDILKIKRTGEIIIILKLKKNNGDLARFYANAYWRNKIKYVYIGSKGWSIDREWKKLA